MRSMSDTFFICPCCGFDGLTCPPYREMKDVTAAATNKVTPPYAMAYGMPSYDVCDCCGFEFGNDDEPGGTAAPNSFESYRREWIANGCDWFCPESKPVGWSLERQLRNLALSPEDLDGGR